MNVPFWCLRCSAFPDARLFLAKSNWRQALRDSRNASGHGWTPVCALYPAQLSLTASGSMKRTESLKSRPSPSGASKIFVRIFSCHWVMTRGSAACHYLSHAEVYSSTVCIGRAVTQIWWRINPYIGDFDKKIFWYRWMLLDSAANPC